MKYDAVIIGSGLGGLECGAMLAREGFGVCVLEKNPRVGGCLQTFRRSGHSLDTGMHYVGSLDDGQILNQYFRYLGVTDSLDMLRMDGEAFDTVVLGGREYGFGMGYERFAANLKEHFPAQGAGIDRLCTLLRQIGGTMSVENLRHGIISDSAMRYIETPAHETITRTIVDPTLQNVLAGTSMLYAGNKAKTTLYHYGMILHSFIESAYRFVGGSQQLADTLAGKIREHGGTVLTDSEVAAIGVAGNRVSGVELKGGEFIEARNVISDIHPEATFRMVDRTPLIKKAFLTRLQSLENSFGTFSVYLIMKNGAMPYLNRNFYIYGSGDAWSLTYDTKQDTPRAVLFNMQASEHGQQHAGVVSLLCPVTSDMFGRWADTLSGKRGEEHSAFKKHLAERIIDFAERRFPGLRAGIAHIYTTSPLSYRDYTATPDGSTYGIVKDCRSPLTTLIPVATRFENLLLTGQNLNVHGALGVTVTAALTCAHLLGTEYLAKKIGNA